MPLDQRLKAGANFHTSFLERLNFRADPSMRQYDANRLSLQSIPPLSFRVEAL
jgi:hypothetical protein